MIMETRNTFNELPLLDKLKLIGWPVMLITLSFFGSRTLAQYDAMQEKLDAIIVSQAENKIELRYHDERIKRLEEKQAIKYSYEKTQLP